MNTAGRITRRGFLAGLGLTAATAAACSPADQQEASSVAGEAGAGTDPALFGGETVAFDGEHQAGIATPAQANLSLVGFNLLPGTDVAGLRRLMRLWTADSRALCAGQAPLGTLEPEMTTTPADLTITCGFGPGVFELAGMPAGARPDWLAPLPAFSRDQLDPAWGQTDLAVQICGNDPTTVAYALRHIIRSSVSYVETAWLQQGFLGARGARQSGSTPRNLFGQKDGTVNPHTDEEFAQQVWIDGETGAQESSPTWLHGGTAMVVRRIFMNLDTWEMLDRPSREVVMGRDLPEGAPLSGGEEFTAADFQATDDVGLPMIDPQSHMARATAPADHPEQKLARRAYNYDLPPNPAAVAANGSVSDSGLVFICFQKNPLTQFVPIQTRLDESDRLNEWITHIGSAVFAVPPGVGEGTGRDEYWGAQLLEAAGRG